MTKENPKYRTQDSPVFVEPLIDWPDSVTDPSQDISINRLVSDYISRGAPKPNLAYGVDVSRVDFTMAHSAIRDLDALNARRREEDVEKKKKADAELVAAAEARLLAVVGQLKSSDLKPGSPEMQALAAELTGILPGFKAAVVSKEPPAP